MIPVPLRHMFLDSDRFRDSGQVRLATGPAVPFRPCGERRELEEQGSAVLPDNGKGRLSVLLSGW